MGDAKRYVVLLVDDDPDDVELTRLMLGQARLPLELSCARSGSEALARLKDAGNPDLILLDLNMPVMSGEDVLRALKDDPRLRAIPVVVFTTSSNPEDESRTRTLGAAGYITKPMGLEGFDPVVKAVEGFLSSAPAAGL